LGDFLLAHAACGEKKACLAGPWLAFDFRNTVIGWAQMRPAWRFALEGEPICDLRSHTAAWTGARAAPDSTDSSRAGRAGQGGRSAAPATAARGLAATRPCGGRNCARANPVSSLAW